MADKNKRSGIHPEMLVGMSAVVIGVCALAVSLYETSLMREEQRAAVIPLVELGRSHWIDDNEENRDRWRLSMHAENVGIGPARIGDFRVTVDGQPYPTWRKAIQALLGEDVAVAYGYSTINGRTIPPERLITIFDLSNTELTGRIMAEYERLEFEACYCSVFDECWTTSFATFGAAAPVESCQRTADSFEE
jgi:hypothetical protein